MGEEREKLKVWSRMETAEEWAGYVRIGDTPHLQSDGVPSHPFPRVEWGLGSPSCCEQKGTATLPIAAAGQTLMLVV